VVAMMLRERGPAREKQRAGQSGGERQRAHRHFPSIHPAAYRPCGATARMIVIISERAGMAASAPVDWRDLAAESPLLAALPRSARAKARRIALPRAAVLFRRGDRPAAMHFVRSGEIRLVRHSRAGGEIVLQRARRGFVAEASLDQGAYHCDAVAAAPSEVLAIPLRSFEEAIAAAAFRKAWVRHLARELRRARAQVERLSLKTARDRIVHYIETEGEGGAVALMQSKKDWAAELGLTHEALYRALAQMRRQGLLAIDGTTLHHLR
jgi:CRP-like cAMP-binding protein